MKNLHNEILCAALSPALYNVSPLSNWDAYKFFLPSGLHNPQFATSAVASVTHDLEMLSEGYALTFIVQGFPFNTPMIVDISIENVEVFERCRI